MYAFCHIFVCFNLLRDLLVSTVQANQEHRCRWYVFLTFLSLSWLNAGTYKNKNSPTLHAPHQGPATWCMRKQRARSWSNCQQSWQTVNQATWCPRRDVANLSILQQMLPASNFQKKTDAFTYSAIMVKPWIFRKRYWQKNGCILNRRCHWSLTTTTHKHHLRNYPKRGGCLWKGCLGATDPGA